MDEIINHFMGGGMQNDANVEEVFEALKVSLSNGEKSEVEQMLSQGMTKEEIIKHIMNGAMEADKQEVMEEIEREVDELLSGELSPASEDNVFKAMLDQLDDEGVNKVEEMLEEGMSEEDIIKFVTMGGLENKAAMQKAREQLKVELKSQLEGGSPNIGEIFKVLQTSLGPMDLAEIDDLMESRGMSQEDIVKHFMSGALDDQVAVQKARNALKLEIEMQRKAGTFSTSFIFNKLRNGLGVQDQPDIDAMLTKGMTMEEIIDQFLKGSMDDGLAVQKVKDELKLELRDQLEGAPSPAMIEESFKKVQSHVSLADQSRIEEMVRRGISKEEVVKHFLNGGFDDKEAVQKGKDDLKLEIRRHLNDGTMTVDIFNTLRDHNGLQDQMKINALLKSGMSMEEVIGYFLKGGIDEASMLEEDFEIDVEAEQEDDAALEDVENIAGMVSTPIPTSTTVKTTTTITTTKATTTTTKATTTTTRATTTTKATTTTAKATTAKATTRAAATTVLSAVPRMEPRSLATPQTLGGGPALALPLLLILTIC